MKVIFSVPDEGYSRNSSCALNLISTFFSTIAGADPEFQVRGGAHLIKNVGIFRVKNHDFTQKNHIFSNFRGGGGARRVRPPSGSAPELYTSKVLNCRCS
jgi:hypothetical protein